MNGQDYFEKDVSVKEAADRLSVSVSHIYNLLITGDLVGYKIGRKTMRVQREGLNALRDNRASFVDYHRDKSAA